MKMMCILTDGFEELEAIGTLALLRRAGMSIDVFAIDATHATGRFAIALDEIKDLKEASINEYDGLFLPGGPHYQALQENETVLQIIDTFATEEKWIAAICAAPTILGKRGLLKGKHYTCFTSMDEDFGGTYVDQYAVCDGNIITGRSAAAVIDFAFLIMEQVLGKEKANEVKTSIYY